MIFNLPQTKINSSSTLNQPIGLGVPNSKFALLRRKAPQIIVIVIIIALAAYVLFEITEDVLIEGTPITSGPLISAIMHFTRD
ncbi:MAG: hypothetical protein ACM3UL_00585, partial [Ignavibacteria bacterium]